MPSPIVDLDAHEQIARIGKALGSARRVQLLELLCQGERSVEALAATAEMSLTNTSQHLQTLRQAGLVEARKDGTKVIYCVADDAICRFFVELCGLARARLAELDRFVQSAATGFDNVTREELRARLADGAVVVLDVRPVEEYAAGHIPGAISVPPDTVAALLDALPANADVVAYCRGPYCLLAAEAVAFLCEHGFRARRLEDGFPEWRLSGHPVAMGIESDPDEEVA